MNTLTLIQFSKKTIWDSLGSVKHSIRRFRNYLPLDCGVIIPLAVQIMINRWMNT